MKTFLTFLSEERVNNTRKTQVATTSGTYKKTGAYLNQHLEPNSRIISIGAGLDQTRQGLYAGLEKGHIVHDMEPNPENRKEPPEYTSAEQIPRDHYHAAVSHNVVNVVTPDVREHVMHSLFNSVREGGHIVIGTRKWKGDIEKNKNYEPGEEPKSMWVKKNGDSSYQKGFDGNELKDYVESYAEKHGHTVEVKKLKDISANGVHVILHKKNQNPTQQTATSTNSGEHVLINRS